MNHTTNYNLNQWEDADRVARADFNADNTKIDSAIKAAASAAAAAQAAIAGMAPPALVKVWEHTTTAAETTQIDVDVSAIALGDYALLLLLVEGRMDSNGGKGISLLVNGGTDGYASNATRLAYGGESALALLYPRQRDATLHCTLFYVPDFTRSNYGVYTRSYEGISTINVAISSGSNPFLAGSCVSLWGVKR